MRHNCRYNTNKKNDNKHKSIIYPTRIPMGSVKDYFSSLGSGIASLIKGMGVTGKEFLTSKVSEQYPDKRDTIAYAAPRFVQNFSLYTSQTDETAVRRVAHASEIVQTAQYQLQLRRSTFPTGRRNANLTRICMTWVHVHSASCA